MHTALLALLLAQLALPGQAAPGGLVYPLGADQAAPGSVYQLGPVGTPSLSWTPAAPAASSVTASTVVLWHFDQDGGAPTDSVGTVTGLSVNDTIGESNGVYAQAGYFRGATSSGATADCAYGTSPAALNSTLLGEYTIAFWLNRGTSRYGSETYLDELVVSDNTSNFARSFLVIMDASSSYRHIVQWATGSGTYATTTMTTAGGVTAGEWHHYAATVTSTGGGTTRTLRWYVDGVLTDTATGLAAPNVAWGAAQNIFLGCGEGKSNGLAGSLDDVAIFSAALSASDVLALYRQSGRWSSPPTPAIGPALTASRASTATYETASGHIVNALSGELRCGYTGCLTEPGRTNAMAQSAALDTWTKAASGASAITVTANAATAPDGTSAADQLAFPAVTAGQYSIIGQTGFTLSASGNTFSIWGRATSGTVAAYLYAYDTTSGSYLGNVLCTWTTTWSRCALTVTGTAGHSANAWIGCDRSSGSGMSNTSAGTAYLWGGQFEAGPWASSLIPTTTTATARAADVLSVPSSVLGSGAASLHLVLTPEWASSVDATLVSSTTANELVLATSSGALNWLVGGNDITTGTLGWSAGTAQTLDAWYTPGGQYRVTDGTHSASGSSASTPSPGTPLYLGGTSSAGAGVAISQVKVCKRAGVCR